MRTARRAGCAWIGRPTLRYVTISREAGAGGGEIARLVGERLGWKVFDKNLLDQVAERFHESRLMLDLVDETPSNWAFDVFGHVDGPEPHYPPAIHGARDAGSSSRWPVAASGVFVGRGAQFLLPAAQTLAVRIVAPERLRIERIMQAQEASPPASARRFIEETDAGRREFVERFFRHDIGDSAALRPGGQRRAFRPGGRGRADRWRRCGSGPRRTRRVPPPACKFLSRGLCRTAKRLGCRLAPGVR